MISSVLTKLFSSATIVIVSVIVILFVLKDSSPSIAHPIVPQGSLLPEKVQQTPKTASICCLILTSPKSFATRATAINATWGPRCDGYFFITEVNNETLTPEEMNIAKRLPIAPIKDIVSGYDHLTQKSTLAFLFAYEQHINDFEWFIKADDDTYLIIDHLKAFLSEQNSSEPITFGYNFKVDTSRPDLLLLFC